MMESEAMIPPPYSPYPAPPYLGPPYPTPPPPPPSSNNCTKCSWMQGQCIDKCGYNVPREAAAVNKCLRKCPDMESETCKSCNKCRNSKECKACRECGIEEFPYLNENCDNICGKCKCLLGRER